MRWSEPRGIARAFRAGGRLVLCCIALLGSVSGAAAGGTAEVLTKGKDVRVPSETVLRFRLDHPVHLRPSE